MMHQCNARDDHRITDQDQVHALFRLGSFGKGTLSRSRPEYDGPHQSAAKRSWTKRMKRARDSSTNAQPADEQPADAADGTNEQSGVIAAAASAAASSSSSSSSSSSPSTKKRKLGKLEAAESGSEPSDGSDGSDVEGNDDAAATDDDPPTFKYMHREHLQLSLPEAFFLLSPRGAGALEVRHPDTGAVMGELECWRAFCDADAHFVERCAVYFYLRARRWVPRSGVKLGVDFVVYRDGPGHFHSDFSILINAVGKAGAAAAPSTEHPRAERWKQLQGVMRMTQTVSKELIICHAHFPDPARHATPLPLGRPDILSHIRLRFLAVRRYVPKHNRNSVI